MKVSEASHHWIYADNEADCKANFVFVKTEKG